jgi:hypothetical protein
MRRKEAILPMKKNLTSCGQNDVTLISLEHPGTKADNDSEGYELHFKWSIDDKTFTFIKGIVTEHNLGFKDYDGFLVIYTPKRRSIFHFVEA